MFNQEKMMPSHHHSAEPPFASGPKMGPLLFLIIVAAAYAFCANQWLELSRGFSTQNSPSASVQSQWPESAKR